MLITQSQTWVWWGTVIQVPLSSPLAGNPLLVACGFLLLRSVAL